MSGVFMLIIVVKKLILVISVLSFDICSLRMKKFMLCFWEWSESEVYDV